MPDLHLQLTDPHTGDVIPQPELAEEVALEVLAQAEITAAELVPWGSNHTFAVALETGGMQGHLAIYKPITGERPLHDFRYGTLHRRERASYLLSRTLGWDVVPPTVVRDGPYGEGSVQIYVPSRSEYSEDYDFWGKRTLDIERMVLFDHIANNADRKITHCLVSSSGKVIGIDHGLTFNEDPKLRTALWQFVGRPINTVLKTDLRRLLEKRETFTVELSSLLSTKEVRAFWSRVETLVSTGRYPRLDPHRNIPYGWW